VVHVVFCLRPALEQNTDLPLVATLLLCSDLQCTHVRYTLQAHVLSGGGAVSWTVAPPVVSFRDGLDSEVVTACVGMYNDAMSTIMVFGSKSGAVAAARCFGFLG
jgi:hypothetical protein